MSTDNGRACLDYGIGIAPKTVLTLDPTISVSCKNRLPCFCFDQEVSSVVKPLSYDPLGGSNKDALPPFPLVEANMGLEGAFGRF